MTISKMYTDATETRRRPGHGRRSDCFLTLQHQALMELAEDNTPIIGSLALVYDFRSGTVSAS